MQTKKKFSILNCYCGIGGNRKYWGNFHQITAIENNKEIAKIYQDFFPNDKVIIIDAHEYLLKHYNEYDFIWNSPPCPSHSRVRFVAMGREKYPQKPLYPDMKLYEEILFLQHYFKGKYVVENVIGYYKPLIPPQEINKHYFWANFLIPPIKKENRDHYGTIETLQNRKGFDLDKYKRINKRTVLRNCVEPETGLHILECALGENKQKPLFEQYKSNIKQKTLL